MHLSTQVQCSIRTAAWRVKLGSHFALFNSIYECSLLDFTNMMPQDHSWGNVRLYDNQQSKVFKIDTQEEASGVDLSLLISLLLYLNYNNSSSVCFGFYWVNVCEYPDAKEIYRRTHMDWCCFMLFYEQEHLFWRHFNTLYQGVFCCCCCCYTVSNVSKGITLILAFYVTYETEKNGLILLKPKYLCSGLSLVNHGSINVIKAMKIEIKLSTVSNIFLFCFFVHNSWEFPTCNFDIVCWYSCALNS